jgi:phosphoadenosine phosphosulfate reductase
MTAISDTLQARLDTTRSILRELTGKYTNTVFANSLGAEDMVLTDILLKEFPQVVQFSLDTGRLPTETYDLMQRVQEKYNYKLKLYYPDTVAIENYTRNKGINAFYESIALRKECCHIRKVEPLTRALQGQHAWITGQRRAQSITRAELAMIEYDETFGLYKANPLADWQEKEVWEYIKAFDVPYNKLHDKFYPSIGCAPCTRAITPGEDIRSGRWWWENPDSKECGLHSGKVSAINMPGQKKP